MYFYVSLENPGAPTANMLIRREKQTQIHRNDGNWSDAAVRQTTQKLPATQEETRKKNSL